MTGIFSAFRRSRGTDNAWILSQVLTMDKRAMKHLNKSDLESLVKFCDTQTQKFVKILKNLRLSPVNATYISKLSGDMRVVNEIKELATARLKEI